MSYISKRVSYNPNYLKRLRSFRTKKIMDINDIEGSRPNDWAARFSKRNHMRTDDIDGATAPRLPKYTGRRSYASLNKKIGQDLLSLNIK